MMTMQHEAQPLQEVLGLLTRLRLAAIDEDDAPRIRSISAALEKFIKINFSRADRPLRADILNTAAPALYAHFLIDSDRPTQLNSEMAKAFYGAAPAPVIARACEKGLAGGPGLQNLFKRIGGQNPLGFDSLASLEAADSSADLAAAAVKLAQTHPWTTLSRDPLWNLDFIRMSGFAPDALLACLDAQIAHFPDAMSRALDRALHDGQIATTCLFLARGAHCPFLERDWSLFPTSAKDANNYMKRVFEASQSQHGRFALANLDARQIIENIRACKRNPEAYEYLALKVAQDPAFPT